MADTKITPQGYLYGGAPSASHPFWDETAQIVDYIKSVGGTEETTDEGTTYTISQTNSNDVIQEVIKILVPKASTATAGVQSVSLTEETTATGKDYTISQTTEEGTAEVGVISVPDPVEPGVQEAVKSLRVEETKGTDKDTYAFYATDQDGVETEIITVNVPTVYVKNITITNENGIYSIVTTDQTGTETTSTIEVPEVDTSNVLAEISDAVVENETDGYDFHTLTETEYNGTKNEVGKFYIAREQITGLSNLEQSSTSNATELWAPTVNQDGTEGHQVVARQVGTISYLGGNAIGGSSGGYYLYHLGSRVTTAGSLGGESIATGTVGCESVYEIAGAGLFASPSEQDPEPYHNYVFSPVKIEVPTFDVNSAQISEFDTGKQYGFSAAVVSPDGSTVKYYGSCTITDLDVSSEGYGENGGLLTGVGVMGPVESTFANSHYSQFCILQAKVSITQNFIYHGWLIMACESSTPTVSVSIGYPPAGSEIG